VSAALPDRLDGSALFLDFDGTLVDIAMEPGAVVVPDNLAAMLARAAAAAHGALAVLSGRPIASLDKFLAPTRLAVAGVHGAEMRFADGERFLATGGYAIDRAREAFAHFAAHHPGVWVEDKSLAISLHYRGAPEYADVALRLAEDVASEAAGALAVQRGKMVVELRPADADKGRALSAFMQRPPFAGRRPIAVGDDLTDEDMFAAAKALGGFGVHVGPESATTVASARIDDPASLRGWLQRAS